MGQKKFTLRKFLRLFMISNPERCMDLFVVMFKLEDGWVGQNQSSHCSNLEIHMEKWTVPNNIMYLTWQIIGTYKAIGNSYRIPCQISGTKK